MRSIDESFQSMISKRYGVDFQDLNTNGGNIFTQLDACDKKPVKKQSLNESITEKCGKDGNCKSHKVTEKKVKEDKNLQEEIEKENNSDGDDFSDEIWNKLPDSVKKALNDAWDEDKTNEDFFESYLSALVDAGIISESEKDEIIKSNEAYGYCDACIQESLNEGVRDNIKNVGKYLVDNWMELVGVLTAIGVVIDLIKKLPGVQKIRALTSGKTQRLMSESDDSRMTVPNVSPEEMEKHITFLYNNWETVAKILRFAGTSISVLNEIYQKIKDAAVVMNAKDSANESLNEVQVAGTTTTQAKNISAPGSAGATNYKNLASAAGETGDYKQAGNLSTGNLKVGSSGSDVKALQTTLNNAGYKLDADGKFGAKTQAALKQYQADRGLKSDGIYGQQTQQAISNTNTSQATANKVIANRSNNTMGTDMDNQYKATIKSASPTIQQNNNPEIMNSFKYSKLPGVTKSTTNITPVSGNTGSSISQSNNQTHTLQKIPGMVKSAPTVSPLQGKSESLREARYGKSSSREKLRKKFGASEEDFEAMCSAGACDYPEPNID